MMMRALTLALLLVPSLASAQVAVAPYVDKTEVTSGITALTMASARDTSCMQVRAHRFLVLYAALTRGATTSAIETKCAAYLSSTCADTLPYEILACTGASCDQFKPSVSIAASRGFPHRFDVAGFDFVKCTFTPTAGAAGDTLTVRAFKSRE